MNEKICKESSCGRYLFYDGIFIDMEVINKSPLPIIEKDDNFIVLAGHLHHFLKGKDDFGKLIKWFNCRIEKYALIEGQDYQIIQFTGNNGEKVLDYILPIEIAKKLALRYSPFLDRKLPLLRCISFLV